MVLSPRLFFHDSIYGDYAVICVNLASYLSHGKQRIHALQLRSLARSWGEVQIADVNIDCFLCVNFRQPSRVRETCHSSRDVLLRMCNMFCIVNVYLQIVKTEYWVKKLFLTQKRR